MNNFVSKDAVARMRITSRNLLLLCETNRRLVLLALLYHFSGVCPSLSIALPLLFFYMRSLYFDLANAEKEEAVAAREKNAARRALKADAKPPPARSSIHA